MHEAKTRLIPRMALRGSDFADRDAGFYQYCARLEMMAGVRTGSAGRSLARRSMPPEAATQPAHRSRRKLAWSNQARIIGDAYLRLALRMDG